jgi:hypothetical protein
MMDGAAEMGWHPDLIIGVCGGSIAAGLIKAFPDPAARRKYVESRDFYELMKRIVRVKASSLPLLAYRFATMPGDRFVPSVFQTSLLDVPSEMTGVLQDDRLSRASGAKPPSVVMIAFKLLFSAEDAGRPRSDRKLFEETYFTDAATARRLQGLRSAVGDEFPASAISGRTAVVVDKPLHQAIRASMAEPFLMQPARLDGADYAGGWPDVYPVELAGTLAEEVLMPYEEPLQFYVQAVNRSAFGFDMVQRLRHVTQQSAYRWIDISDFVEMAGSFGFDIRPARNLFTLRDGVPDDYETFVAQIRDQWQYGKSRALESFRFPVNDKTHIRNPRSPEPDAPKTP